jgi:hypothetical protein
VGSDPVRIVPVHPVEQVAEPAHGASPLPPPGFTYRGGPLLGAVEVVTIFWGSWWDSGDGKPLAERLNGFFDFVLSSELLDQLAEYGGGGTTIGHGKRTASATVATPQPKASLADAAIQEAVLGWIADGTVPAADANTLYFVYLPPDVSVAMGGSRSCQAFCGFHNAIEGRVFYAVMPYPGCAGCTGEATLFDALTSTSSHELCEAITDPVPGTGWYDDANGEVGDICAWQTKQVGNYTVQLEWSNGRRACV